MIAPLHCRWGKSTKSGWSTPTTTGLVVSFATAALPLSRLMILCSRLDMRGPRATGARVAWHLDLLARHGYRPVWKGGFNTIFERAG